MFQLSVAGMMFFLCVLRVYPFRLSSAGIVNVFMLDLLVMIYVDLCAALDTV
jgi:hypothetical protein